MEFVINPVFEQIIGLFGGLYVAFVILKPISKIDFFLRGSVSLITGYIFTDTIALKLDLDITAAAFIAACAAWPVIGLMYMFSTNPKILIEFIKAWRK